MSNQRGFTLIELVMVIVILGILAATAIPKFVDLQRDARLANIDGAEGAMRSSASMVYARALLDSVENQAAGTVTIDGNAIPTRYGYPSNGANWSQLIDLSGALISDGARWIGIDRNGSGTITGADNCGLLWIQKPNTLPGSTFSITRDIAGC